MHSGIIVGALASHAESPPNKIWVVEITYDPPQSLSPTSSPAVWSPTPMVGMTASEGVLRKKQAVEQATLLSSGSPIPRYRVKIYQATANKTIL